MNKYMIVVWKWDLRWTIEDGMPVRSTEKQFADFIEKGNKRFEVKVEAKDGNTKELKFIGYTNNNSYNRTQKNYPQNKKYSTKEITDECSNILKNNHDQVLLLLHANNPDNFNETNKKKLEDYFKGEKIKIELFYGGGNIYDEIIDGGNTYFLKNAIINPLQDTFQIKQKNFDVVWDYYWNKLDLEYQKKKTINLWLPLAINIQGLSEVGKENGGEYFNEIKNELIKYKQESDKEKAKVQESVNKKRVNYFDSLTSFPEENEFPRWEEIKNSLEGEYKNFTPSDLVNDILSANDYNSFKSNENKYLDSKINNKPNPTYLPNWLQEVVSILDDKINPPDVKKQK